MRSIEDVTLSFFASTRALEMAKLLHKRGYKLTISFSKTSRQFVRALFGAFFLYVEDTYSQTSSIQTFLRG